MTTAADHPVAIDAAMRRAVELAVLALGRTSPNPVVGCVVLDASGRVVGEGHHAYAGGPHAEVVALRDAGDRAAGGTAVVTLEPCRHTGRTGPCTRALLDAGVARVVIAVSDPTDAAGGGAQELRAAGVEVVIGVGREAAEHGNRAWLHAMRTGRPRVTWKVASTLDGRTAAADGTSRWITGPQARAHTHLERSRHEAILVGRGTLLADAPRLDVRLPGLEGHSPRRILLSRTPDKDWETIPSPAAIADLAGVDRLMVEGGAQTASAFLAGDLVDRLLLYRAPILIGEGRAALGDIGLAFLAEAHGRWRLSDSRMLGSDRLEVYERA